MLFHGGSYRQQKYKLLTALCFMALPASGQIRWNQVGCYPQQEKIIVTEGANPKGKVRVTTPDGKTIKPKATIRKAVSPLSQKTRYVVDLGPLEATGRYRVTVGSDTCSLVVAERPFRELARASLRLFYLIRSGVPIELGGPYNRPLGHPDNHVLVHNSAASPLRPAGTVVSSPLGWYDAGDYNKYVVNSAFSIGLMFSAFEQQRAYFSRLKTDIPESANETPDFLDEMMFNLRWLLTMQDPFDGGVYHKLTTPDFEGFILPTACRQPRYVVQKSVTATLDFAAVMADAARLFEPYQTDYPGFSAQAAAVAERAYQWAKENPEAFYHQWTLKDPAVTTGTYGDRSARDEFFWAASALYRLTGKQSYLTDAEQYLPQRFTTPSWGNVAALGAFEWMAGGGFKIQDSGFKIQETMQQQLLDYCEAAVTGVETSSFQSPYGNSPRDFGWGSLAEKCCCQALALLYADKVTGTEKYRRFALQNADYLLGRNATGYCYVTGFGVRSPMHPHHRPSAADNVEAPFPGMLVGGPNPGQQDARDLHTATYPSAIPDESYIDDTDSYASNEIAINWNASLVAFICWLDALAPQEWQLVWSDEFDRDGRPDTTVWNFERGFVRNHEAQWYQPENAFLQDGKLIIEARREQRPNPTYRPAGRHWGQQRPTIDYTSACLTTRGQREFLYGRLEVCARIPTAGGAWPAIWTLGTGPEWPSCGEIDIMEYYRIQGEPHILANAAWGNDRRYQAVWNSRRIPYSHFTQRDPDWAQRFHIWRMDWDETAIRLSLDDELLNEIPLSKTVNGTIGHHTNPFTRPQYILLNLALGGDNGGEIDDTAFPMRYEIDYVRIYQK